MALLLLLYTFVAIILSIVLVVYWKLVRSQKRLYDFFCSQHVPGEPFMPIVGQVPEINRARARDNYMEYYEGLVQKHGHVFLIGFGPIVELVVMEPDMLADVLGRSQAENYTKTALNRIVCEPLIGVHNLLVSNGTEHERARKMINLAFHFINLKSMVSVMVDQTEKAIDGLFETTDKKPVNLQTELSVLALAIIASCAFGKGFETIDNGKEIVCRAFTVVLEAVEYRTMRMINFIPVMAQLPFWRKDIIDKGTHEMNRFVEQIIADRRQGSSESVCSGPDLLDLLLLSVDPEGQSFTDQEIKEEALTFVLAGHETTGNLIVWVMYV
jgi:cytochrome P450